MGTSQSSSGPPANVPMVPPWVPDPPTDDVPVPDDDQQAPDPLPPLPLAPARRFAGARRSLGGFSRNGDEASMRRGLGQYIRNGYGGSGTATRRFGGTISTAGALYGALSASQRRQAGDRTNTLDPVLLAGRSAQEVMDAIVEAVQPPDGTQDGEASRAAIRDALTDLLTRFPEANLLDLTSDQRVYAIERYVAMDVFRRFDLDLGKTIRDKAPNATTALSRLKQVREYIKQTVSAAFRTMRNAGQSVTSANIGRTVRSALTETFQVFEGYAA